MTSSPLSFASPRQTMDAWADAFRSPLRTMRVQSWIPCPCPSSTPRSVTGDTRPVRARGWRTRSCLGLSHFCQPSPHAAGDVSREANEARILRIGCVLRRRFERRMTMSDTLSQAHIMALDHGFMDARVLLTEGRPRRVFGRRPRRVCVIGAGISGLVTAKVLLEDGFDPLVFEKDAALGGVWSPS